MIHRLLIALVLMGAGLRLWQYLANTSLWLDELAVARNILDRSVWKLLTVPLAYDQTAPKGFLLFEKIAVSLFGQSDYVLRFLPLASSLIALVAFWRIVERLLDGLAGPVALALFATAPPFLTFGSQVKQYSSDVVVAILLLLLALDLRRPDVSLQRALWLGAAGALAVWFSQPAVLVILALSVVFIIFALNERRETGSRRLLVLSTTLGLWVISALSATLTALASMTAATREYMHRYWAAGFPQVPMSLALKTLWPWDRLERLIGTGGSASLAYPAPALYLGLAVLGFAVLWHRNRSSAALLIAPICLTLAAAVARQYPFSDRLILFLVPSFFIAIGASAEQIREWLNRWSKVLGVVVLLLVVGPAVYPIAKTPPVYQLEDMKPVLSYMQARRRSGDLVYVYYGAAPHVTFYARAYGLHDDDYSVGGCTRGDTRHYFEELDMFRGRPRVWVLITHALPLYRERDDILRYLDTIGIRRDGFAMQSRLPGLPGLRIPAEAFLYDLSDPVRLSRATSASSPVTGPSSANARSGCGEGPQAMGSSRGLVAR